MMGTKPIILIGSRQDNYAVQRAATSTGRTVVGIVDRFYIGQTKDSIPVIASDLDLLDETSEIYKNKDDYDWFVNTIFTGTANVKNNDQNSWFLRNQRAMIAEQARLNLISIHHQNSYIDPTAKIGKNVFVGWGTYIGAHCNIGDFNFFAYNCGLPHHITTGNFCTFAGTTTFIGNTVIGRNVFVGPGVTFSKTVKNDTVIGNNVIITPGTTVMRSIEDSKIYFSNNRKLPNRHFVM